MPGIVDTAPAFDNEKVTVIFVLGGPGAGKGTQCARLVKDFHFCHLSGMSLDLFFFLHIFFFQTSLHIAGDLLRAEQNREGSQYGTLIQTCIREGTIVPMEVTIKLLEHAMAAAMREGRTVDGWAEDRGRFLIDGFPRKMDQALKFDETVIPSILSSASILNYSQVCLSTLVIYFSTTEQVMLDRLLERAKTSGREDDNVESIKKRFRKSDSRFHHLCPIHVYLGTYKSDTMPVIEHYASLGKVAEVRFRL